MLRNIKTAEQVNTEKLEKAMEHLRAKRNKLLAETDYLALSDNTLSADMITYRQALRDITNNLTTVEEVNAVVFPVDPLKPVEEEQENA